MKHGCVTVIVPVYNARSSLDRCVESITAQTYQDLEIILVDDGSVDGSGELCEEWKEKDSRVKVIHKENAGAGMARNTGIDAACGEYVCFCDSDDWLDPDTVGTCYERASAVGADIVRFGLMKTAENGKLLKKVCADKEYVFREDGIRRTLLAGMMDEDLEHGYFGGETTTVSCCMISTALIERSHWRIVSEREYFSEDVYSLLELFACAKCAVVLDRAFYRYCCNGASMTQNVRENEFGQIDRFYGACIDLCDRLSYGDEIRDGIGKQYLNFYIAATKKLVKSKTRFGEKFKKLGAVLRRETLQEVLRKTKNTRKNAKKKILFFLWRKKLTLLSYVVIRMKSRYVR